MGKKKTEETLNTEDSTPTEAEESAALAKVDEASLAVHLGNNNALFMERFSKEVARVSQELPTQTQLQNIMDSLPDELADSIIEIIRRASGKRKGVYSGDDKPDFPELRIYHGTGNDPNRPENQIPGQYYLTTKENIGSEFEGTVIALVAGRTMWGDSEAGESVRMPICNSMDREMGSTYGDCKSCPHRPWKDGKRQKCADDVVVHMLAKNLEDIVLVRFAKTSEPGGKQLMKFVKRSVSSWSKWYKITSEARTSATDKSRRWFVMMVEPEEELVPEALHPFCDAMCSILEATHILPRIATTYRQAQEALEANNAEGAGSTGLMGADTDTKPDYGDMDDAPDDTNV